MKKGRPWEEIIFSLKMLYLHGFVTEGEKDKIEKRILKKYQKEANVILV